MRHHGWFRSDQFQVPDVIHCLHVRLTPRDMSNSSQASRKNRLNRPLSRYALRSGASMLSDWCHLPCWVLNSSHWATCRISTTCVFLIICCLIADPRQHLLKCVVMERLCRLGIASKQITMAICESASRTWMCIVFPIIDVHLTISVALSDRQFDACASKCQTKPSATHRGRRKCEPLEKHRGLCLRVSS